MAKSVRLPDYIKPINYHLTLRPDMENFTFFGEELVDIEVQKSTKEIIMHAAELEVDAAEIIQKGSENWAAKISYDEKSETVKLVFPKQLQKGKAILKVVFRGILNDKLRGFYRSRYFENGKEKYLATTQFEPVDARRALPCFDEPTHKATFEVNLIIPDTMSAISNTIEEVVEEHDPGFKIVKFTKSPKMSTYLLAFLIGEFEFIEGRTTKGTLVRVFVTPGKKHQAEFALEVGIKCLSFYEKYFGIPYPLPVMDMIAVPDFASGAMENWGAVTYRETALLIDPEKSAASNRQRVAIVIAHELAHMWFGDLVTMEWWTHLWLNEGFASYMEYIAIDDIFPEWEIWTQFLYSEQQEALDLDGLDTTHPIEVEVHHPNEIGEIFDKISYSKGASVIRMLADYLGPKDFRDGLRFYLKTHKYSNAKTEDLWQALEKISGKPVGKIMKNWTSKPGYPLLNLEEHGNKLKISQQRFFSSSLSKKASKDQTIWQIPLSLKYQNSKKEDVLIDKKSILVKKVGDKEWLKLNVNESSVLRVNYPTEYLEKLKLAVISKDLDDLDRFGLVRDVFDLSESGDTSSDLALDLALGYKEEDNYTVWAQIVSKLGKIERLIHQESFYPKFEKYGLELFTAVAKKIGWEKKKGESHSSTLLRSLVLGQLGSFGDKETVKKAKNLFEEIRKGKSIDADLRGVAYTLTAQNGGKKEYEILKKMYIDEELQQEKDRIMRAMCLFKQPELLGESLKFGFSKHVRSQDSYAFIVLTAANFYGRDLAWDFMQKNWGKILEYYGGKYHLARIVESLGDFNISVKAKEVEVFFKKNQAPSAERAVLQTLEQIHSNIEWLRRDKDKIEKFLISY